MRGNACRPPVQLLSLRLSRKHTLHSWYAVRVKNIAIIVKKMWIVFHPPLEDPSQSVASISRFSMLSIVPPPCTIHHCSCTSMFAAKIVDRRRTLNCAIACVLSRWTCLGSTFLELHDSSSPGVDYDRRTYEYVPTYATVV